MAFHSCFVYRLGDEERTCESRNPMPTDSFRFNVRIVYRYTNRQRFSVDIPMIMCKSFFSEDGYDFLRTHLAALPYFTSELVDEIIPQITSLVEGLFDDDPLFENPHLNVQPCVFPLYMEIVLDVWEIEVMEEGGMIPASKDAVESLKTVEEITKYTNTSCCSICMEEFHVNGDVAEHIPTLSAMPCNHVFHQRCILLWLQTSHTCPLCRYTMPTAAD